MLDLTTNHNPVCGKTLEALEPFKDTEENEWNYQCKTCGLDITIFETQSIFDLMRKKGETK